MAVHPFCSFRGVEAHLDLQLTLSHGIAPSQCQIRIPPTPNIDQGGTLVLSFGGTQIVLPQCRADFVDANRNADGLMVWTLTILDRRWKWKECGKISGYYNVREGENENAAAGIPKQIKKGTEKSLRDLMKLCLEAMGEKGFNLSKVPADIFPEVEWDYALPAEALAKLADTARFRIVYNYRKDRVELWPDGEGQKLTTQGAMDYQQTIDPPERPDRIIFVGSRKLWEMDIALEAVARDANGTYWPINSDKIPYRPDVTPIEGNYWWGFDYEFANGIKETPITTDQGVKTYRDIARADVYRKYRIAAGFNVDGIKKAINDIERILPLLSTRLVAETVGETTRPKSPAVWGLFTRDEAAPEFFKDITNPVAKLDSNGKPPKDMTLESGFQLDTRTGILTFDQARFQFGKDDAGIPVFTSAGFQTITKPFLKPAKLWLRVAFGVRDEDTRGWLHEEVERKSNVKKFGTQPRYVSASDAVFRSIRTRDKWKDNKAEYEKIANHYLDQVERQYVTRDPCAASYMGWLPIAPDGAIQQITWSLTEKGATTRVSRNREEPVLGLTYDEQRLYQQLRSKIGTDATTSREARDKTDRRVA